MSSFLCDKCGKAIQDTPYGYVTGCKHYPLKNKNLDKAKKYKFDELIKGMKELYNPPRDWGEENDKPNGREVVVEHEH